VNPDSSTPTFDHAAEIGGAEFSGRSLRVLKEGRACGRCCTWSTRDDIYVVPNFISEGYFTRTVIPRELELTGPVTQRDGRTIKYCEPVGNHQA